MDNIFGKGPKGVKPAVKAKAKPAPKKPVAKSAPPIMPMATSHTVRVEPISNGFLTHVSHDSPKGYKTTTTHHASKPKPAEIAKLLGGLGK